MGDVEDVDVGDVEDVEDVEDVGRRGRRGHRGRRGGCSRPREVEYRTTWRRHAQDRGTDGRDEEDVKERQHAKEAEDGKGGMYTRRKSGGGRKRWRTQRTGREGREGRGGRDVKDVEDVKDVKDGGHGTGRT